MTTKMKDENGNFIPWTGRPTKKNRTFGGRFSVQHSSASGWYVFDNLEDRTLKAGLYSLNDAVACAKATAAEFAKA
jgi:hypothetical protein